MVVTTRSKPMNKQQYEIYHETKSHTSADFPYNTYLCSIPLDFSSVPTHWHEEMELIVIKKGSGKVTVDLVSTPVTAGDIVFVLPGQLHAIEQLGRHSMEYENIIFKPTLLKTGSPDLCYRDFLQPFFSGIVAFSYYISPDHPDYAKLNLCIEQIDQFCSQRPEGYQLAVKGLLYQMFFHLISQHPQRQLNPKGKKFLDKIKIVLSYIQENYARPITVKEIAEICFYSESHFMKFFKDCMGVSFTRYLNDYRLQIAAQLLKETEDNILEIAIATGFENLSYFNRAFKKKYGLTPGGYRNQPTITT